MTLKFSILTILLINFSNAQLQNLGFENSTNNLPDNWSIKKTESYDWKIDNSQKYQGQNSFQIVGSSNNTKTFQSFYQKIPIEEKGRRKIEISAYVKSENIDGKINLWFQVLDKDGNKKRLFDFFDINTFFYFYIIIGIDLLSKNTFNSSMTSIACDSVILYFNFLHIL